MRNRFKVPVEKWKAWTVIGRRTFNGVFEDMKTSQHLFLHPKAEKQSVTHWQTTAWNAAWVAADHADANGSEYV